MNLPQVIQQLVIAQNSFDSTAYANLFTENATVFDEARTYKGKAAINVWVETTSKKYKTIIKPLNYDGDLKKGVLKTEVSGTFPGSPFVFSYNFEFDSNRIQSLQIS